MSDPLLSALAQLNEHCKWCSGLYHVEKCVGCGIENARQMLVVVKQKGEGKCLMDMTIKTTSGLY